MGAIRQRRCHRWKPSSLSSDYNALASRKKGPKFMTLSNRIKRQAGRTKTITALSLMLAVLLVSACAGGGSGVAPAPAPQPYTRYQNGPNATIAGPIFEILAQGFGVDGSSPCGKIDVATNSSTTYFDNGLSIAVGTFATVTGSGNCATNLTAARVVLSSNLSTITGSVTGLTSGGFIMDAGAPCGHVSVAVNNQTITYNNNQPIGTGQTVQVTGSGSCSSSLTATLIVGQSGAPSPSPSPTVKPSSSPDPPPSPSPSPSPIRIPTTHVMNMTFLGYNGFTNWGAAAPWLSWAEIPAQIAGQVSSTGIKTMFYTDPNRQSPGDPMYTGDESTFAHDCSGNRIFTNTYHQYVMDPHSEDLAVLWQQLMTLRETYGTINAVLEDNAGGLSSYAGDIPTMPCNYSESDWVAADQEMEQDLGLPVIYNGLSSLNGQNVSTSIALNSSAFGGMFEHCYANKPGKPKDWDWVWRATENTEIQMAQQHKLFMCLGKDTAPAASSADGRTYAYASFMLTYDLGSSVVGEEYTTSASFDVVPESELVALNPLIQTPTDISGLLVGSVYAREYASCYIAGNPAGPCAFVVNPDYYNSHPFPFSKYHHTLQMNGGGILDGGTVTPAGPAPPTTLPPLGSAIAFQ